MKLLNEDCKFQCIGNLSMLITASEKGNTSARDGRKKILTDQAKCEVKSPLPCNFLTALAGGTPTNCQLSQTQWLMTSNKMKCNGNNVLTDKSTIMCSYGGNISPISSGCISSIGATLSITDMDVDKNSINCSNCNDSVERIEENNISKEENENNSLGSKELKEAEEQRPVYASHTLCNYEECEEREQCEYFNSQIYVKNDSSKLSSNFQNNRKDEWQEYLIQHQKKNMEYQNGSWRIAAHHMISGNQVLMVKDNNGDLLYGEIVKLANYFGYDVNNEWNCIMLPANESNFGELEQIQKFANAFDVMWIMGRQWHVGGHQYSLDIDTLKNLSKFYEEHPEQYPTPSNPNFFSNYITAMKEEMDKLLLKYSRNLCWKKNYEKRKKIFFQDMDGLSKRVERYLLNFKDNPRSSFPFFVSKVSVEYAYNLPATSKLVIIYSKGSTVRAKRIRLERYMKNELRIVPIEKDDIEITDGKQLAIFCENVMHFIIDEKISDYSIPFKDNPISNPVKRTIDFGEQNIMRYLLEHASELIAFVNSNPIVYQPIAKIVGMRGGE